MTRANSTRAWPRRRRVDRSTVDEEAHGRFTTTPLVQAVSDPATTVWVVIV